MKIQDRINPYNIPSNIHPDNILLVIRDRILQIIMNSLVVFGLGSFIASIFSLIRRQSWLLIALYGLLLFVVFIAAFMRSMNIKLRASIILAVLYILGLSMLLDNGLGGDGRLFLVVIPMMAATLLGVTAGTIFSILSAGTILVIGWLVSSGTVHLLNPGFAAVSGNILSWVTSTILYVLLILTATPAIFLMIVGLERTAVNQKQLSDDLLAERNTLEQRVEARTAELSRRASDLELISRLARDISTILDLSDLLHTSINLIEDKFEYYHTAIFTVDANQENLVMLASAMVEGGEPLLPKNFRVKLEGTTIVGEVARTGVSHLSPNIHQETQFKTIPQLKKSVSELAIQLKVGDRVLGVLDLQSDFRESFLPQDVELLQNLADQLSVAMDKDRLFRSLQANLDQVEGSYKEYTRETWRNHLQETRKDHAYRFRDDRILPAQSVSEISNRAFEEGRPVIVPAGNDPATGQPLSIVSIPIKLRGQILGTMEVQFTARSIPEDTINMLDITANRLSLALENARLLEAIQIRADHEHVVSHITSRVRSSTDIDGILRTAALELGRSLGISEVKVQLLPGKKEETGTPGFF